MIDPYETIINYLLGKSELTSIISTRIAMKHKYGFGWNVDETSLIIVPNGGSPDLYKEVQRPSIQARIYGTTIRQSMAVWKILNDISRQTDREVVSTASGNAMIYWLNPTSGPALVTDDELEKNIVLINFDTQIGEMVST